MRLLIDTHVFLWWDGGAAQLPVRLRSAIESRTNQIFVSAASIWEIAIKRASGKLIFSGSAVRAIETHGFLPLPISVEHAELAGSLPELHRDPFDRLLVAQACQEELTLVTVDPQILRYQVRHL